MSPRKQKTPKASPSQATGSPAVAPSATPAPAVPQSRKSKPARKPPALLPVQTSQFLSGDTAFSSFQAASGGSQSGVSEVDLTLVDFFDVPADNKWTVVSYDPTTLPGVSDTSSTRFRHCRISLLQEAINITSHADLSIGVLAGVRVTSGNFLGEDSTLLCAKQTLVLPSSTPKWVTVYNANLAALAAQGMEPTTNQGTQEVGRLSLITPDTGNFISSVTGFERMQARVELAYSTSFPLTAAANFIVTNADTPLGLGAGTVTNGAVFPRVTGVSRRV